MIYGRRGGAYGIQDLTSSCLALLESATSTTTTLPQRLVSTRSTSRINCD